MAVGQVRVAVLERVLADLAGRRGELAAGAVEVLSEPGHAAGRPADQGDPLTGAVDRAVGERR